MEPRIQYANTKDGVNIAYSAVGDGPPLVVTPLIPSHIELLWQTPYFRRVWERLAQGRRTILYDSRGNGLSERNMTDFSLNAWVLDLEAVVDRLQLQKFALMGVGHTGPAAITYAVRNPNRVTNLMLWHSWANFTDDEMRALMVGTRSLIDRDWNAFAEMMGFLWFGLSEAEQAQHAATLVRESTTPQELAAAYRELDRIDVSDVLPEVKSPTLVLYPREARAPRMDVVRRLVSQIPDARLAVFEGRLLAINAETLEAVGSSIDDFLGEGEEATPAPLAKEDVHTILFTDVEGSTALTQRLGDAKARDLLREHERMVREALKSHGGSELKTTGDGFMASFSSATKALECSIAMQREFAAHNQSAAEPILVRVGMNAGEPIAEEEDLFGTAVIRAARIAAEAKGGEILVSNVVRELAEGKQFLFADRGEVALKGFDEPVRLYEVRWQG
jgi:class 3 adenylate cyclase